MSDPLPTDRGADQVGRDREGEAKEQRRPRPSPVGRVIPQGHDAENEHDDGQDAQHPLESHPLDATGVAVTDLASVLDVLQTTRFRWATEEDLQTGLAAAFEARLIPAQREVRLDGQCRIDFLVGRVGIEVKVAGSWRELLRQVMRYLRSDRIDALVVVTSRPLHTRLPVSHAGKPVVVHRVGSVM